MAFSFKGPLVPVYDDRGEIRQIERNIKTAFEALLGTEDGTAAIERFKSNGSEMGHKVLDDYEAVRALEKIAGDRFPVVLTDKVSAFRKSQLLNAVIRQYYVIGKDGKVTGDLGPKLLKMTQQPEPQPQPQQ